MRKAILAWLVGIMITSISCPLADAQTTKSNPVVQQLGNGISSLIQVWLSLAIVLLVAILVIRFMAKRTRIQQRGTIEVLAARQVAPSKSVQVIGVQGRRYLIGVGDQITLLADVTDDPDSDSVAQEEPRTDAVPFGSILAQSLQAARAYYRQDVKKGDGES